MKILGISASLRNARRGTGNDTLIQDIMQASTEEQMHHFIEQEAALHLKNFEEAGRKENLPFDEMYTNLKKQKGNKGLSNSEVALVSALWSVKEFGVEIDHVSLAEYFTESGEKNLDELKNKLMDADGYILSTPVYFGDRGSLSQSLIDMIRADEALKNSFKGKLYAGIAVGAKRNGGQETTLIYQLMDMLNVGALGVGNDSETTSQYGGTGVAGDVGTMPKDKYGLDTSMGTGRRIARVVRLMEMAKGYDMEAKPKVQFWILQDKNDVAEKYIEQLIPHIPGIDATIVNLGSEYIMRCLGCDICPTHIDVDEEYRCIIKSKKDAFLDIHELFTEADAIIPVVFSPKNRNGLVTNYQKFLERTRYLRRGDYVFSDLLVAPFIIDELGSNENLHIRLVTSMIRHHTIMSQPLISFYNKGAFLNTDDIVKELKDVSKLITMTTIGRVRLYSEDMGEMNYNPVGYVLSVIKDNEDQKLNKRKQMIEDRIERIKSKLVHIVDSKEKNAAN
ncbi:NAD(P)H-dependent oxidoreductase [Paracrocinitomix mangrovi]|uniref:NAD(P)H-dependent oxidoreductase n=1 Tax=Paracrocinitomix mangrovi TaxID=2862509 RepID=UPI001C8E08F1|nr:NAD(P)H-dependent oxidoreductase [Paracrocinitomix mangrovi]UKN01571.1 NAD(P)H-dependent oxidoreductase [Paracrocinitomix mangrovi]